MLAGRVLQEEELGRGFGQEEGSRFSEGQKGRGKDSRGCWQLVNGEAGVTADCDAGSGVPAGSEARGEGGTQVVHDHCQWAQQGLTRRPQISLSCKSLIIPRTRSQGV